MGTKKRSLFIFVTVTILLIIFLPHGMAERCPVCGGESETCYIVDDSFVGEEYVKIQSEWSLVPTSINNEFMLLDSHYTRWQNGHQYLIVVFDNQLITQYMMYDEINKNWKGTQSDSLTVKNILSMIGKGDFPETICDVGSGTTINTIFSCDGYIVAWTDSGETMVFDALTLKQTTRFFLYQLFHGVLI